MSSVPVYQTETLSLHSVNNQGLRFQVPESESEHDTSGFSLQTWDAKRDLADRNEMLFTNVGRRSSTITGKVKISPKLTSFTEKDFYAIPTNQLPMDSGPAEHNTYNRYRNILPYNKHHVKLTSRVGFSQAAPKDPGLYQYVNANYVAGYNGNPNQYICLQAPKDVGIPQLWRLIWQDKVKVVAMLTRIVEKNKKKCCQYWPATVGDSMQVLGFHIKNVYKSRGVNSYITTILELTNTDTGEVHVLSHFWFDSWPDLGVPTWEDGQGLVAMLDEVAAIRAKDVNNAPFLVHCSAGIGRTGVLVSLDYAMDQLQATSKFNLVENIQNLRTYRAGMVQAWEQGTFILKLLRHVFDGGSKDVKTVPVPDTGAVVTKPTTPAPEITWNLDERGARVSSQFL